MKPLSHPLSRLERSLVTLAFLICFFIGTVFGWALIPRSSVAEIKAKKFDDYCQSVRAFAASTYVDLRLGTWRDRAIERFALRGEDVVRCASISDADLDAFHACHLRNDRACVDNFVLTARDAIAIPPSSKQ